MSRRTIEWAAGLFEGEGTIVVRPTGRTRGIQIVLVSTDEDVVRSFHEIISVGKVFGPLRFPSTPGNCKEKWEWRAYSSNARQALVELLPYLGKRRSERAREALSLQTNGHSRMNPETFTCPCGKDFTVPPHRGKQFCSRLCYQRRSKWGNP